MADAPPDAAVAAPLETARRALERGDYGQVLRLLEPLASQHPPATSTGAGVRLLMATALMGQGQTDQAASCCRSLSRCPDPQLRAQARDLLLVLEAPALQRPRRWSITMPDQGGAEILERVGPSPGRRRSRRGPPAPPPPPVGPTQAPLGFAALVGVLLAILLLAGLLGGCMEVRTDLEFQGPGRLRVAQQLRSTSGQITPWQRRLATELTASGPFQKAPAGDAGSLNLRTPLLPAAAALEALTASLEKGAALAGVRLPAPSLELQEDNWLVGVRQRLLIRLDLSGLPEENGLDLAVRLTPVRERAVRRAEPRPVRPWPVGSLQGSGHGGILWPLQGGRINRLELHCWRWSPLGVGGLLIGIALVVVLALQRIRQRLGFGLPELPA